MRIITCLRNLILGLTLVTTGFIPVAMAEAPMAKKQVPGYYRMMHGQFEVTVLFDGAFDVGISLMSNATQTELQQLLARNYIDGDKVQTATNVYLINTGKNLVLIDVGCGTLFGPKMGKIMDNLKAAGYAPEQVDTILLTHMHPDHVGGLVDANGNMLFPNAKVYANQVESDFWLSDKNAGEAKNDQMKNAFKNAKASTAPYRAAKKWHTFQHKDEVVPGIRAVSTAGHTPGHTMFRIKSDEQRFFILGDLVISHTVQFTRPDVTLAFDINPEQSVITRYKVFNLAAKYKWMVAGAHLPYPGIGQIRSNGDGTYGWIPVQMVPE
ncbi:MBL fold metallo-hydrolase [Oxalobacter vibrioformis]|uniref:MBL fold metallo-hydrolase n=1 Tax=Oxalobacter vibrioformis TaxID=933080 RepID=A0A9E9LZE2_9BURK|nr:MBL fold metallo-hydrolase [Oxalobacter vibrioformis]WAW10329.1 MBL fold metallo-hydrolase [Oxalobacter vibrioformis]